MLRTFTKLAIPVFFVVCSAFNQPDAKTYYDQGLASLNKQDYIQAIGEFTNAISLKPDYADAWYYRGQAKDLLGKKMGFFSPELCTDFATALKLGKADAAAKVEKSCMGECYDLDAAFVEPELVYCADFNTKSLTDLPAGSEKLAYIVKINMSGNKLTTLSDKWGKLTALVSVDLSQNKLTTLPPVIGKLTNLKELSLNKNQIGALPFEFGNLKYLKILNLRMNGITTLPKSVAMLTNLENLDLTLNKLTDLPLEIANLKNLKTLTLVGNEIAPKEQAKIKALLPKTTIYFE